MEMAAPIKIVKKSCDMSIFKKFSNCEYGKFVVLK